MRYFQQIKTVNEGDMMKIANKLTESKSNTGMQYYGPYNGRKVKKLSGSGKLDQ